MAMKLVELTSAYTPYRRDVQQEVGEESMTRQEFADECDINNIMARYEKTGVLPANVAPREPQYLDLTVAPSDLMESMHQLHSAEAAFMSLPAKVRKEFDNDPYRFVEFAADDANRERMVEFGLCEPVPAEPVPQLVQVVNLPEGAGIAPAEDPGPARPTPNAKK